MLKVSSTKFVFAVAILLSITTASISAQTTAFSYQGSIKDGANPANGNYDFEFALYDALSGGTQIGSTLTRSAVSVSNGIFSVNLDFGQNFPGANRFLEIHVRQSGGGAFTPLAPRQAISSAPYAVKSLNADAALTATNATNATNAATAATANNSLSLGGVAASQYVLTGDPRMSDARNPLPGSNSYIQNGNGLQAANQNISGNAYFGGNVGIGTTTPGSRLGIQTGNNQYGFTHTNGTVSVGSYVDPAAGWFGTRSNHPLNFFTNDSLAQVTLSTSGNVGIGTTNPAQKLHVTSVSGNAGTLVQTPGGSFAQYQLKSGAADAWTVGTQDNFADGALLLRTGTSDAVKIQTDGTISQLPAANGLVKAMLLVNADGTINLCYNSQAAPGTCGITVNHAGGGTYDITFPFQVNVRFFSVTMGENASYAEVLTLNQTQVRIITCGGNYRFYLMVY